MSFVHLHTHSHMSTFDGLGKEEEFVQKAKEIGSPALALTEHGSVRGFYNTQKLCDEAGIKFIPGAELYFADNASERGLTSKEKQNIESEFLFEANSAGGKIDKVGRDRIKAKVKTEVKRREASRRERFHVTVWALSDEGIRNLYKLTTWSWTKGFYYKPRIDINVLRCYSEGLAVSTGCAGGIVAGPLREGDTETAFRRAEELTGIFGNRFYVEIMPHVPERFDGVTEQLVRLADRFELPIIVTQDAHYPNRGDAIAQENFLCIQTRDKMSNPDRFHFDTDEYWMRSREEMIEGFERTLPNLSRKIIDRGLDETLAFADRVVARIPKLPLGASLPVPSLPEGVQDVEEQLARLCLAGAKRRFGRSMGEMPRHYKDRLRYEIQTINERGFASYFLVVEDMLRWARENKIFIGPGRGSAAGSMVSYMLGITELDPIQYGLSFERFIAPGRMDLPDIDNDIQSSRRDEVVDYFRDRYGEENVAQISTYNVLGGKQVLRDLARIHGIPESEVAPVSGLIVRSQEEEAQDEESASRVLKETEEGRVFSERYPDIVDLAYRLEGQVRQAGVHPAGVIVSSEPLTHLVPIETRGRGEKRVNVTAFDMTEVEGVGLVKIDILGLKTLDRIEMAFKLAGKTPQDVDLEDKKTYEGFTSRRFAGVFQFDSSMARSITRGFTFKQFSDVAVMTALNRPGPIGTGLCARFIERAGNPDRVEGLHPIYDEVFQETLGVPVYQEQIMDLAKQLCGYSAKEADAFRKKIAKKKGVSDERERFLDGARANGMEKACAEQLFEDLSGFGAYAFNKSHAYIYSLVTFYCMWLKTNFPGAFYAAALAVDSNEGHQIKYAAEAKSLGIEILPPDVNLSGETLCLREEAGRPQILGSLTDVRHVGPAAAKVIAESGPYKDLVDFRERAHGRGVSVKVFSQLARSWALRGLYHNSKFLIANSNTVWDWTEKGWIPYVDSDILPDWNRTEMVRQMVETWPLFAEVEGRELMEAAEKRLSEKVPFHMSFIGDEDIEKPGFRLVIGKVGAVRMGEEKTARVIASACNGSDVSLWISEDVVNSSNLSTSNEGEIMCFVIYTPPRGKFQVEAILPLASFEEGEYDRFSEMLLFPPLTNPRDIASKLSKLEEGKTERVEGVVFRRRLHKDKNGNRMLTVGILSQQSYARFFVFSSRLDVETKESLAIKNTVSVRLKKLSGEAFMLTDTDVEVNI